MPGANTIQNIPFKSSGAAVNRFRFVTQVGNETVKQSDGAGQAAIGVAQAGIANPNAGGQNEITLPKAIAVMQEGNSWVEASGAIAIGARVSTDANGRAKTAATGEVVLGEALTAAAALGDLLVVALNKSRTLAP